MKLSDYAKKLGISYKTAYRHFQKGEIEGSYQLPTGTIIVPERIESETSKKYVVYARVSSSQNKSNLESQADRVEKFCEAAGLVVSGVVKEVGSGLNDSRKKLQKLLSQDCHIVVEHKDRLTRFGFKYIDTLLSLQGRKIIVINEVQEDKEDLMQDLISVITSFVARYYGRRRSKRKTEKLIAELNVQEK